jgi:hypothetical protein
MSKIHWGANSLLSVATQQVNSSGEDFGTHTYYLARIFLGFPPDFKIDHDRFLCTPF